MLEIEFAQLSDVGRVRDHNEDYCGHALPANENHARSRGWLFVLADGVGGHENGEVASRKAVEGIVSGFHKAPQGDPLPLALTKLVQRVNTEIYEEGHSSAGPSGLAMATTVVACALRFDRAVVAHVGDSRCYLIRRGKASLLTRDHTVANEQLRIGVLSSREASISATKHMLSRSVGHDLFVNVDTTETLLSTGDVLLLCSDGLHGAVSDGDIAGIVQRMPDLNQAARELVELANYQDGGDNVTVQLIRVQNVERVGMYRGKPYRIN
jgi:serine/threonine protein phosphatase PrpC